MKPTIGKYQTATQVKVLSPETSNIGEADSFHPLEGNMIYLGMARDKLLSRGLSPWYDIEWRLQELGRALTFFVLNPHFYGHVRDNESGLIGVHTSPILALRKKRYSKVGDDGLKRQRFSEDVKAVGLTHSRGVTGVMPCEGDISHSKGLALICKGKETHSLNLDLEELWKQN